MFIFKIFEKYTKLKKYIINGTGTNKRPVWKYRNDRSFFLSIAKIFQAMPTRVELKLEYLVLPDYTDLPSSS